MVAKTELDSLKKPRTKENVEPLFKWFNNPIFYLTIRIEVSIMNINNFDYQFTICLVGDSSNNHR